MAISSIVGPYFFIKWFRLIKSLSVPVGYGVLLPIFVLALSIYELRFLIDELVLYSAVLIFALIYFIDDLFGISPIVRLFLSALCGVTVLYVVQANFNLQSMIWIFCFVSMVNFFNFQDGADLNVAILFCLMFSNFLFISEYQFTSTAAIIFLIGFMCWNIFPKNIYFGDSGVFASCALLFAMTTDAGINQNLILMLGTTLYVFADAMYVIVQRLVRKENLLSRNYLHLYQIFNQRFGNKLYLGVTVVGSVWGAFLLHYFCDILNVEIIISCLLVFIGLLFTHWCARMLLRVC